MAAPWGVVYVDPTTERAALDVQACILAHELTHARQFAGAGRAGRYVLALRYLLSPWTRRRLEIEAEINDSADPTPSHPNNDGCQVILASTVSSVGLRIVRYTLSPAGPKRSNRTLELEHVAAVTGCHPAADRILMRGIRSS